MTRDDEREVQRKLPILPHVEKIGHFAKPCRYSGIALASFCRRKRTYKRDGEAGLANAKTIPDAPWGRRKGTASAPPILPLVIMDYVVTGPRSSIPDGRQVPDFSWA